MLSEQGPSPMSDALMHLSRGNNWFDIYKAFEVIRSDIGEETMARLGDVSKAEVGLLRRTANYHRHADLPRPTKPMLFIDAHELLRKIMRRWIEGKSRLRSVAPPRV
jgi:hypothetical protein